jgi:hypothetical protein
MEENMCEGCYEEYGRPTIINGKTLAGAELVRAVYKYNGVGGNLHVQLDDWNIDDEFWDEFKVYHADSSAEQVEAEKECFEAFKHMNTDERASALAIYDGFLTS